MSKSFPLAERVESERTRGATDGGHQPRSWWPPEIMSHGLITLPIRDGLLIILTAALLVLSFPSAVAPQGVWPLGWIALAPLLFCLAAHQPRTWKALLAIGSLTGILFFYGSFSWLGFPFVHWGGLSAPLTYGLLAIPAVALGLFFGAFALLVGLMVNRWGTWGVWVAPPLWVVVEWARYTVTGQGWNSLGYSQAFRPEVIQFARLTGVYGVSFLLVAVSAALALGVLERHRIGAKKALAVVGLTMSGCLLVAVVPGFFGRHVKPSSNLHVLAVQPVISVGDARSKLEPPDLNESLRQHLHLSEEALSSLPPDAGTTLLIWPESPMNMSLDEDAAVGRLLGDFARQHDVYLLVNHLGRAAPEGFHNSAAVISPHGQRIADYHKTHLLVFGEYVPFQNILPLGDWIPAPAGDFVPGTELTVVSVGPARVGTFICFESAFPSVAREMVRRGATVLVNISNDGWFGTTAGAYQHLAHAVFRAVETGTPLVRVTNSGITALITPRGEITDATELHQPATRRWRIEVPALDRPLGRSFYTRYGDLFVLLCGLVCLAAIGGTHPFRR